MARFDLLEEYTCVVVPKRLQRAENGETAHCEESLGSPYGKSSWRGVVAMIALLNFINRESLSDRQQMQVHRF